jgi:hypothetical protein
LGQGALGSLEFIQVQGVRKCISVVLHLRYLRQGLRRKLLLSHGDLRLCGRGLLFLLFDLGLACLLRQFSGLFRLFSWNDLLLLLLLSLLIKLLLILRGDSLFDLQIFLLNGFGLNFLNLDLGLLGLFLFEGLLISISTLDHLELLFHILLLVLGSHFL